MKEDIFVLRKEYDTINLRFNASFDTLIFPEVRWIPYITLGTPKHTKDAMLEFISTKNIAYLQCFISNPYEIIQYLQLINFTKSCNTYKNIKNIIWEIHDNAIDSLVQNKGSCASVAAIGYYFLHSKYNVGILGIISNLGNGHAINFMEYRGDMYFIDFSAQTNEHVAFIPIETGIKSDFLRSKYITGGCLKTNDIKNYIHYFEKYNFFKRKEYLFFICKTDIVPPISFQIKDDKLEVLLPNNYGIDVLNAYNLKKISCCFVDYSCT